MDLNQKTATNSVKFPFNRFESFCVRIPLLPLDFFIELTSKTKIVDRELQEYFSNSIIREAIFLASPQFFAILVKWSKGEIANEKKISKIRRTFLKYLIRMSSRSTPYGLFAGCSSGSFTQKTLLEIQNGNSKHIRITRIDMYSLVRLGKVLESLPTIQDLLFYKLNSSLYRIGNRYRYVETRLNNMNKQLSLESVDSSPELDLILSKCRKKLPKSEIIRILTNTGLNAHEAENFFLELLDNQILISDLHPNVTGPDFLEVILKKLSSCRLTEDYYNKLKYLISRINHLDNKFGNEIQEYQNIQTLASKLFPPLNFKYFLQTDLFPQMSKSEIGHNLVRKIKKGIKIIMQITEHKCPANLTNFKERFIRRFDSNSVPLLYALDVETGVGYTQNPITDYSNQLFEGIEIFESKKMNQELNIELSRFHKILIPKILKAIRHNYKEIILDDTDIERFDLDWKNAPNTLAVLAQIIQCGKMQKVFIHNCSANAGRMLARFSYGNENLKNLMNEIVSEETRLEDNCIIAEIVHLPEERTGNILRRPHLYKYELPYLCNSTLHEDNLISLNELEVKILNGEIILYSNKLQARILPKLTNAHNYRKSHSSVYQFLCDLQFQNHGNIGFDWAGLREIYDYMPRLIYDDVILSKAQWKLNSQILGASLNSGDHTIDLLKIWQENMNVPRYISVVQGDKRLCLDLSNDDCLEILMDLVLKTRIIWLEESFINPKHQVITDGEGVYTHEIIIPFYKR